MKLNRFFIASILGLLFSVSVLAQNHYSVKAIVKDASNKEVLSFVTVGIARPGADRPTAYCLSSEDGSVLFEKLRAGKYIIKAELLSYKLFEKQIEIKDKDVDLGEILLVPSQEQLREARVSAVGNPIQMKADTISFTASSVKTTDNDMLEDLLKKIPGIEVSEDGSITHNGKAIDKITVEGKTFFLNDPQLASKNLPANIVDKVRIIEKKSDQAEFTGIDDGEEETVLDLNIKKGMMDGFFGNFMLGGGHDVPDAQLSGDGRYQGAGFLGKFSKDEQISIIANSNNTNNRGFRDFSGSMMGAMGGPRMGHGQGGWGRGNGITTSSMLGVNGATSLFDDKMDISGNYNFNDSRKDVMENTNKTTYLVDGNLNNITEGVSNTNTGGHGIAGRMEHKFSDNTSIIFEPRFNIGYGDYNENSKDSTSTQHLNSDIYTPTNSSVKNNLGSNKNFSGSGFALLRQKLGMPGRTMTVMGSFNLSRNSMDGINNSITNIYDEHGNSSKSIINQNFNQVSNSTSLWANATFTQPLGSNFYLEANYSYSWARSYSQKETFDALTSLKVEDYSNSIYNDFINHNIGFNALYQGAGYRFQLGLNAKPSVSVNKTNNLKYSVDTTMTRFNWAPSASAYFDMGKNGSFRMYYYGQSQQPSTSQLITVADNSNPLSMSFGNPYLSQYFSHNIRGDVRYNNKKTYASINMRWNATFNDNPIVNGTWYTNGIAYNMPMNGPANYNFGFSMHLNLPIKKSGFTIMNMARFNYSSSSNYVGTGINTAEYINTDGSLDYANFFANYDELMTHFEQNHTNTFFIMERFVARYRNDNLEMEVGVRSRMNASTYELAGTKDNTLTFNNQLRSTIVWTIDPVGLTTKGEFNYNWYNGYATQQPSQYVFNLELQKLILKKKATLALKCYDILGQSRNLTVTDTANYHSESVNNTLGRYIILSFIYRFGDFGKNRPGGPMMGHPHGR